MSNYFKIQRQLRAKIPAANAALQAEARKTGQELKPEDLHSPVYPRRGMPDFHPQFRLEGRTRDPESTEGLLMRIADPLWMLGRQWQFGEFVAEDNGSPISAKAFYKKTHAKYYTLGKDPKRYETGKEPLEAGVEAMPIVWSFRDRVRIGQQMERLVRRRFSTNKAEAERHIYELRKQYRLEKPEQTDQKSARFVKMTAGKAIDGGKLLDNPQPAKGKNEALKTCVEKLEKWYNELFFQPAYSSQEAKDKSAWNPLQLAHQFQLKDNEHDDADFSLSAPDYQSGELDWYSFDKAIFYEEDLEEKQENELGSFPVNASFPGAPDKRLFAFEDSRLDMGRMNIEVDDLPRLMLLDFAMASGNDWYVMAVPMELGELCWVTQIEVADVFGVRTIIENDEKSGPFLSKDPLKVWDIFKIRDNMPDNYYWIDHFLFLPPALTHRQESPPLEEILFLRDEYANMVWGLEKTVRNDMGRGVDGYDRHLEINGSFQPEETEDKSDQLIYRMATVAPFNWIPYLPVGTNKNFYLERAYLANPATAEEVEPMTYLAAEDLETIREDAIPREGVRVQLTRRRARWTDGKTYVWQGRRVRPGMGEGSSGLRFDSLNQ